MALGVALVALLLAIGGYLSSSTHLFGANATGPAHYQMENFLQGVQAGTSNQFSVSNTGVINLTKSTFCINFYATSTATQMHMVASTTATLPNGAGAVMTANYGSCS